MKLWEVHSERSGMSRSDGRRRVGVVDSPVNLQGPLACNGVCRFNINGGPFGSTPGRRVSTRPDTSTTEYYLRETGCRHT